MAKPAVPEPSPTAAAPRPCAGRASPDHAGDARLLWALSHPECFPLDVNRAPRDMLLRVPGLGARAIDRIIAARRRAALRLVDLDRLTGAGRRIRPFVAAADWRPDGHVGALALQPPERALQLDLFAAPPAASLAIARL